MPSSRTDRRAVSNALFGVAVIVLLAVAASGFYLYATRPVMQETMTVTASETMSHSSTSSMSETSSPAVAFTPAHGQMFGVGWLLVAPLGNGSYAVSIYATGLEPAAMGDYIVEAAQNTGQMATVPIAGSDATQSEFTADGHGNGQFFVVLNRAPSSIYESVSIVYLPQMQMTNAMVVATAPLATSR